MQIQPLQYQGWGSRNDGVHKCILQSPERSGSNSWHHQQMPYLSSWGELPFRATPPQPQPLLQQNQFGINSTASLPFWTTQSELSFSSPTTFMRSENTFHGIRKSHALLYETPPPEAGHHFQNAFLSQGDSGIPILAPLLYTPLLFRNLNDESPFLDSFHYRNQDQERISRDFMCTRPKVSSSQVPYSEEYNDFATPTTRYGPKENKMTPLRFRIRRDGKRHGKKRYPSLLNINFKTLEQSNQVEIKPLSLPKTLPEQPPTPDKLYHYTTDHAARSIIKDQYLRPKGQAHFVRYGAGTSARFGKGIYFTHIPPDRQTEEILTNNYGSEKIRMCQIKRTNYCFEFDTATLPNLVFCADESCMSPGNVLRRFIWMAEVQFLDLKNKKGVYYERVVNGFGYPKEVNRKMYEF